VCHYAYGVGTEKPSRATAHPSQKAIWGQCTHRQQTVNVGSRGRRFTRAITFHLGLWNFGKHDVPTEWRYDHMDVSAIQTDLVTGGASWRLATL